jgi:uncharacterized protein (TIGR03067 family)
VAPNFTLAPNRKAGDQWIESKKEQAMETELPRQGPSVGYLVMFAGALALDGCASSQNDRKNIQGMWQVVSAWDSGRETPREALRHLKWTITKDRITYRFDERTTEWAYRLQPTRKPKAIDLTTENGHTMLGIYDLECGTLRVCFDEANRERPTAFESKPNSANDVLVVLNREDR